MLLGMKAERIKDLIIAIFGFLLMSGSVLMSGRIQIQEWVLRFGHYAGMFTFLIYILRLRFSALGIDPDSKKAFKDYLKLGSFFVSILFIAELPLMLASLG